MWKDIIIEELYQFREEHAKKFNYNLTAIFEDLKAQERNSTQKKISLPLKNRNPSRVVQRARR
jgi:hypothetical protein